MGSSTVPEPYRAPPAVPPTHWAKAAGNLSHAAPSRLSSIEHVPHSDPPKVLLKSLNPEYDSYERPAEEVRVVGRAVWVSRRL